MLICSVSIKVHNTNAALTDEEYESIEEVVENLDYKELVEQKLREKFKSLADFNVEVHF